MAEVWDAEWNVTADIARAAVSAQFPDLADTAVAPLSWGFDNAAYVVGGEWVFRFPRRAVAVPLIEREASLLPVIAPTLPIRIPLPEMVGQPCPEFPHPFVGYRLLSGTTACRAHLTDQEHGALAEPLGAFLRALHAFPADRAATLSAAPDPLGRLDVPMRVNKTASLLAELRAADLVTADEVRRFETILGETPEPAPRPHLLLHGDLYSRHMLVDQHRTLAGIIDWGDIHLGHPATDLEIAYSFLPATARGRFRDAYGSVDGVTWKLARFRALGHTAYALRFAHIIADADLEQETRWALDRILEE